MKKVVFSCLNQVYFIHLHCLNHNAVRIPPIYSAFFVPIVELFALVVFGSGNARKVCIMDP